MYLTAFIFYSKHRTWRNTHAEAYSKVLPLIWHCASASLDTIWGRPSRVPMPSLTCTVPWLDALGEGRVHTWRCVAVSVSHLVRNLGAGL